MSPTIPSGLAQRITNVVQMETRGVINPRAVEAVRPTAAAQEREPAATARPSGWSLEAVLKQCQEVAAEVLLRIREGALLETLGVELMNVYFLSAKPTAEVGKALEAEYRETLLRRADEAIYARRAAAVEEERKIKENELHTDISLEQRRQELIELQGTNAQQEAVFRGRALETEAEYQTRALQMELAAYQAQEPRAVVALALRDLGQNAARVGNLTITTEILAALLNGPREET